MENRRQKEIEYMKAREKRVEDYEQQLHNIRVQDSEEYNRIKIRMETDVQVSSQISTPMSCCIKNKLQKNYSNIP